MARFIFITGGVVSSLGKGLMAAIARRAPPGARLQGPPAQARSLSQRRSGDDVALPAWRGLRHRRRRRDRSRSRPLRALHRRPRPPVGQRHLGPDLPGHHPARAARRLSRRHRPGDPPRHQRDQGVHPRRHRAGFDFVLCEIGGTVGDIESLPFIEAIRQFRNEIGREPVPSRSTPRSSPTSPPPAS